VSGVWRITGFSGAISAGWNSLVTFAVSIIATVCAVLAFAAMMTA